MMYAEREWDYGALAEFVPENDGHDIWRMLGGNLPAVANTEPQEGEDNVDAL